MRLLTLIALVFWAQKTVLAQPVSLSLDVQLFPPASGAFPHTSCAADMDGDGLDDNVRAGGKGIFIDFQQKTGGFRQRFFPVAIKNLPTWSLCAGDLNNDGLNDLLFANAKSASFLLARPDGSGFDEKPAPIPIFSQRSTMADIDADGWLDAFICNDTGRSRAFRNLGFGEMVPDQKLVPIDSLPGSYGAVWTDLDGDHDLDLHVSKCLAGAPPGHPARTNLLFLNDGTGHFQEKAAQAGLADNAQSWSAVFEDFNNDGHLDAFTVNHDDANRLFWNNGDGTFTDGIAASGINPLDLGAWENAAADLNNDGFIDIFSELKNQLYLNNGDGTFTGQNLPVTPGALADLNGDGFLDIVKKNWAYLNQPNGNHWLKIRPVGGASNRAGIGARIQVFGPWGVQTREVRSGESFSPMNSLNAHFGLGAALFADSACIFWPSGMVTKLGAMAADSFYIIGEAACMAGISPKLVVENGPEICAGDSAILSVPAGFSGIKWSNGSAGNTISIGHAGHFFAVLIDPEGCAAVSKPENISFKKEKPPVVFSLSGNTFCRGDTIELAAWPPGAAFDWSNGEAGKPSIRVAENGFFTASIPSGCSAQPLVSAFFETKKIGPAPPVAQDTAIFSGDSVLLTAVGEQVFWYDSAVGGQLLATGAQFQTMPLTVPTSFFVENRAFFAGETMSGGKLDTAGQGSISVQTGYLNFEATLPFRLVSVNVLLPDTVAPGVRFVQFFSGESLIAFKQFQVQKGWNELALGFDVPVGSFSLRCPAGKLFRNTGPLAYPFPLGDAGQIVSSSFGTGHYFYFYDWKIQKPDASCTSERKEIRVQMAVPTGSPGARRAEISISPNPARELILVNPSAVGEPFHYKIFDGRGRETLHGEAVPTADGFSVDIEKLAVGIYSFHVFGKGFWAAASFLKQ